MEIELKLDGELRSVFIPENWNQIRLHHYMKLTSINKLEYNIQLEKDIAVIAAFIGISTEDLEMIDIETYNQISESLQFLLEVPEDQPLKDHIKIGEENYYLKKDFEKLTLGERISIDTILMDGGVEENFDKMLTLFLKKKNENGELETYRTQHMNRVDLFRAEVNFMDVKNILLFFSTGTTSLENNMKESLVEKK